MGPINSLTNLISALWRKAWLIMLVLAIGLPLVLYAVTLRPRVYEAISVVQIAAPGVEVTANGHMRGLTADGQLDILTQQLFARSSVEALITNFNLFRDLDTMSQRVAAFRGSVSATKLIDAAQAWRPDVQPSGLTITVRLDDPTVAAEIANALVDQLVGEARSRTETRTSRTLEFLIAEEARVAAEVARIENEIATYRGIHLESLPEGLTAQRDRLTRLNETRLDLEQQLIELQSGSTRMLVELIATQEALLINQLDLVRADIALVEAALAAAPEVERNLTALTRNLDQLVEELTVLTRQRTEAATADLLASQEQAQRFIILETATPPEVPVSTSRTKTAIAGGALVAFFAVGLALMLEVLNPAIRTADQLERALGVQPVITVPVLRSRRDRWRRRFGWIFVLLAFATAIGTLAYNLKGSGASM